MKTRNHVWVLSNPTVVLPRRMWFDHAIDGAKIRHGSGVEISRGSVGVDGRPAGVCLVASGPDGAKTVLTRFALQMV